ncbi:coagulation factor 5/8 type domain-containing protein [Streptomyces sp. NPDC088194]|uniref:coagulation factor 5/8 type domain-containing protein n=1 Tax=Streptomyces sp. NPDC088194 TaxID=3154931 RepID=UPI003450826F
MSSSRAAGSEAPAAAHRPGGGTDTLVGDALGRRTFMTTAALPGAVPVTGAATPASAPASTPAPLPGTARSRSGQRPPYARQSPPAEPDFGPHVKVFGPDTPVGQVQAALDAAAVGGGRSALLFRPGRYAVDVRLGPRTSVSGLGAHPDDVTIDGAVRAADQRGPGGGGDRAATDSWRAVENLAILPAGGTQRWEVSPAAPLRRVHVRGRLLLCPGPDGACGDGFIADSVVDGEVLDTARQCSLTRDSRVGGWPDPAGRQVFAGVEGAPAPAFPDPPSSVPGTAPRVTPPGGPLSREKPFLYVDEGGRYRVFLPALRHGAVGASWAGGSTPGSSVPIDRFFVARPSDSVRTLNKALSQGRHLLLTPGCYELADTIKVKWAGTVVLGLGHVTLAPRQGVVPMTVADARRVRIAGLRFDADPADAGPADTDPADADPAAAIVLLEIGARRGGRSDPRDPASVQDVRFRIGDGGRAATALVVNSDHVLLDHVRVWRAGPGTGEDRPAGGTAADVVVNGDDVRASGLFVARFLTSGVARNGEGGRSLTGTG